MGHLMVCAHGVKEGVKTPMHRPCLPLRQAPTLRCTAPAVGIDAPSLAAIKALYSSVYTHVVPVSSLETAEMTKLYENCFRMINIAYVNEVADQCGLFGERLRIGGL